MNHKQNNGIIFLFLGIILIVLGIVFSANPLGLPDVGFLKQYPLFISGLLFAAGIVLVVRGLRKKDGSNDNK